MSVWDETRTKRSHAMSDLGSRLALDAERDDPQLSSAGRKAGMPVRAAGNSELHCGLVRVHDPCPRRARRRPSTDRVGVLAGARYCKSVKPCKFARKTAEGLTLLQ